MKTLKLIIAGLFVLGPLSANADVITLTDTTTFGPEGTNAAEDYVDHGCGTVNKLQGACGFLGPRDFVKWNHLFDFDPDFDELLSATLSIVLGDDEKDRKFFGVCITCEFGYGFTEGGEFDIGEIDSGTYSYNVGVSSLEDGVFQVTVRSLVGDFYIHESTLSIDYKPVPEPGTLALLGLGLAGLGLSRRKKIA